MLLGVRFLPRSRWREDYNHNRPHSALGMMTAAIADLTANSN
jgi:transposase InsO family protein